MDGVVINPGSGPVEGATLESAAENMKHFVVDVGDGWQFVSLGPEDSERDGCFPFLIWQGNRCHEVLMPGLPLDRMRYMGDPQNIWDYPRLYVDGSSWVWVFAIGAVDDTYIVKEGERG